MKVLALDLGTTTGWAFHDGQSDSAGSRVLVSEKNLRYARKLRMDRRCDPRATALYFLLKQFDKPDYIIFEDVRFGKSLAQVQIWSSLRGVIWAFSIIHGIQVECLDTGKLKKFATGNGGADKPLMARSLCKLDPDVYTPHPSGGVLYTPTGEILDDNAVDALHLLRWGKQHLSR